MAGISVGGLASGLDTDAIISQLIAIEQQSILRIQQKIAIAQSKQASYNDLDSRLGSLRNAVRGLNDESLFSSTQASSSNEGVVTVTASKDATAGVHSIRVLQVATKHQITAQGFIDERSTGIAAGNGTFTFKVGSGTAKTIDVNNTTTLRQFADAINAEKAGIRAEIVNDGSSTNPYRLVLTSESEGTGGQLTISHNDTTLNFATTQIEAAAADAGNNAAYLGSVTSSGTYTGTGSTTNVVEIIQGGDADGDPDAARFRYSTDGGVTWDNNAGAGYAVQNAGPFAMSNGVEVNFTAAGTLTAGDRFRIDVSDPLISRAQDAVLKINGINVTKSSNTITDVYEGVTLKLKEADAAHDVRVEVRNEIGDVTSRMTSFIGAYNSVVGFLNAQFSYNPAEDDRGQGAPALNGDSAARQIQSRLKNFVTGRIRGLTARELSSLSEIGVDSDQKTGAVTLNSTKLEEALAANPKAVQRLLTRFGEGLDGAQFSYLRRSAKSQPGEYEVNVTSPRSRAEVAGLAAAEELTGDETLSIRLFSDAQVLGNPGVAVDVELINGDSPATQVSKINTALTGNDMKAEAFLDSQGTIHIRAKEFGNKYRLLVSSTAIDGPGTSNIGDQPIDDTGTNLAGMIGGHVANVLDETHLKGATGFASQDVEVVVPDDTFGLLGRVRIVDGMGESLPDVLDSLSAGTGLLRSRTEGVQATIDDLSAQVVKNTARMDKVEDRLRKQFTSLEVTLGQLQALGDYVTAQLGTTSSKKK